MLLHFKWIVIIVFAFTSCLSLASSLQLQLFLLASLTYRRPALQPNIHFSTQRKNYADFFFYFAFLIIIINVRKCIFQCAIYNCSMNKQQQAHKRKKENAVKFNFFDVTTNQNLSDYNDKFDKTKSTRFGIVLFDYSWGKRLEEGYIFGYNSRWVNEFLLLSLSSQ